MGSHWCEDEREMDEIMKKERKERGTLRPLSLVLKREQALKGFS